MLELRMRTKTSDEYIKSVEQKILGQADVDVLLCGDDVKVYKPDGNILCVYLHKAIPDELNGPAYDILKTTNFMSTNRGAASGSIRATPRRLEVDPDRATYRSYARPVPSGFIGTIEASGAPEHRYCRLTAWTGQHLPEWQSLQPYLRFIADRFAEHVPARYAAQMRQAELTKPEWIVPNTPFTTVTVNDTYPTGVHKDVGDLKEGFSCLAVHRHGNYTGGFLTFPAYRVAANLRDGDLILMDAHEWHGNVAIEKHSEDARRISVVCYFRTNMVKCGTMEKELERAATLGYREGAC